MTTPWMDECVSLDGMVDIGVKMAADIRNYLGDRPMIIGFYGTLGSGKTTLIRSVIHALGGGMVAVSPTFDLIHRHDTSIGDVLHMDLYRLTSQEVAQLDLEYYLDSECRVVFVEWPERAPEIVVDATVFLEAKSQEFRRILGMFK
jgi:tRNA threonylcarbamoyl adenosine modification protein YjeE